MTIRSIDKIKKDNSFQKFYGIDHAIDHLALDAFPFLERECDAILKKEKNITQAYESINKQPYQRKVMYERLNLLFFLRVGHWPENMIIIHGDLRQGYLYGNMMALIGSARINNILMLVDKNQIEWFMSCAINEIGSQC